MSKFLVLSVLALSFTTGFTCSKNAPEQAATPQVQAPTQADMAAPVSADASPAPAPAAAPTETK